MCCALIDSVLTVIGIYVIVGWIASAPWFFWALLKFALRLTLVGVIWGALYLLFSQFVSWAGAAALSIPSTIIICGIIFGLYNTTEAEDESVTKEEL